jgi:hypothetical protein
MLPAYNDKNSGSSFFRKKEIIQTEYPIPKRQRLYYLGFEKPAIKELKMPTISIFFGIYIRMFFDDHMPPHFHAEYGEYKAKFSIDSLEILDGKLPGRVVGLVLEWAAMHRNELRTDWELCIHKQQPEKILPLE